MSRRFQVDVIAAPSATGSKASRSTGRCATAPTARQAGAPVVGWTAYPAASLIVTQGTPSVYASSEHGRRHFCRDCGTGVFYFNDVSLPGIADIQTATLDDPEAMAPQIHVQVAERISWMASAHELPAFERYPTRG